jgi:hypothetical protein
VVRLYKTQRELAHYTTLSHCWGKKHIVTTTKATLEQRKLEVQWPRLSRTFQDAINITRALGIRYIWIDSLCIYSYRTAMKHLRNLRFMPQFSEGFDFWGGFGAGNVRR